MTINHHSDLLNLTQVIGPLNLDSLTSHASIKCKSIAAVLMAFSHQPLVFLFVSSLHTRVGSLHRGSRAWTKGCPQGACLDEKRITTSEIRYGVAECERLCETCVFVSSSFHLSHSVSRIDPIFNFSREQRNPSFSFTTGSSLLWTDDLNVKPLGFTNNLIHATKQKGRRVGHAPQSHSWLLLVSAEAGGIRACKQAEEMHRQACISTTIWRCWRPQPKLSTGK
jgi:hypothetical protein